MTDPACDLPEDSAAAPPVQPPVEAGAEAPAVEEPVAEATVIEAAEAEPEAAAVEPKPKKPSKKKTAKTRADKTGADKTGADKTGADKTGADKTGADKTGADKTGADKTPEDEPKSENMDWYILKVQSNREDSIRDGLLRRVAIAGLEFFFGDVIVPIEKVTEFKGGKKRVLKRKLYPGYLVVHMEINDDTWFLVRETPGIGDFTGAAGHPTPMLEHEVARIVSKQEEKSEKAPKLKISVRPGDQVKITEGTFENFEGEVDTIDETNGRVTVMINIFGRSTPVELEYWQIESV